MAGLLLLMFGLSNHALASEPRRVLLLHAFGHPFSPWSDMAGSFRAELIKTSSDPIDLFEVSLDTAKKIRSPEDEAPFIEYIRTLLSGHRPDLIVPVGAPAAFFMQRHRQELFPMTPMLIVGADTRRIPDATLTERDTGVLLDLDLPAYLENVLRLRPETTDIAVVVGDSPVERYWTTELQRDFQRLADRVKIEWLNDLTFSEMLDRAAAMPPSSAIFWFLLSEDAAGVPYSQDRALEKMREVAAVPIFGMGDYELGRGIVGGPLMQTQFLGQEAAAAALRILGGEAPGGIKPPPVVFGAPMYDWRELQRWDISENRLPAGSVVGYREPTILEQYRWYLIGAVSFILFQALLIVGLFLQRARRQAAEIDLRSKESALRFSYEQVRQLAGRLINAQEEERARIARELHDDVGQRVASLSIGLSGLKGRVPDSEEAVRRELSRLQQQTVNLAGDLRDLSHELHQGVLDHVALPEALRERCDEISATSGTQMWLEVPDRWLEVKDDVKLCLYRVAQEALRNIAKHAHAKTGRISLARFNGHVVMSISDDGLGFKTNGAIDQRGIGLLSMRERVRMLGGRLEVTSSPNAGTVATVTIPTEDGPGDRH
ncbi:histidine kinase [Bradyrhizobium sp. Pha-3]|uniref:sensor histidine kinase n=1 Tax=Bradyrhizobium sp. Pha-3 TaxID=208375 RepID=UPI0035D4A3C0